MRYWDDMKAGEVVELGSHTMDQERMLSFAREFDPQPFHTDPKAAEASVWGGLIASGWHTGSTLMRLFYDGFLKDTASLGSPGIDELRWLKPVRPGDTLTARLTVTEATGGRSFSRGNNLFADSYPHPDLTDGTNTNASLVRTPLYGTSSRPSLAKASTEPRDVARPPPSI